MDNTSAIALSAPGKLREERHPIGVVADRTGLSPSLLRVWERRYGAVEPSRAGTGHRLYSDADVERLRLMYLATLAGRGIGQVARLSTEELAQLVREDEEARQRVGGRDRSSEPEALLAGAAEQASALVRVLDASGLEHFLRRSAAIAGVNRFLDELVTPLLHDVAEDRAAGHLTAAAEHLASATTRRVLDGLLHLLTVAGRAPHLLVATPAGERHEIDTVIAAVVAAAEGWRVTYLGSDVDASEIASAATSMQARAAGVTIGPLGDGSSSRVLEELRSLRAHLPPTVPLLVGGTGAHALAPELLGAGTRIVEDLSELRVALRAAAGARPG